MVGGRLSANVLSKSSFGYDLDPPRFSVSGRPNFHLGENHKGNAQSRRPDGFDAAAGVAAAKFDAPNASRKTNLVS